RYVFYFYNQGSCVAMMFYTALTYKHFIKIKTLLMKFLAVVITSYFFTFTAEAQDSSALVKKIKDSVDIAVLDEVVITASRIAENMLQSPVSIEKVSAQYFKSSPAPSFFDALENVKGVQMIV